MRSRPALQRSLPAFLTALLLASGALARVAAAQSVGGDATAGDEPPPLRMSASLSETYDDNLARSSALTGITSDFITRAAAGATVHRGYGQQVIDADVDLGRSVFRFHPIQDFTAINWLLGVGSEVGRDGQVGLALRQTQDLMPLENFQSLIRDVVTNRSVSLTGHQDIGVRYRIEALASHSWYSNDNALYSYNDNQSNSGSLGLVYRPSADTYFGVRVATMTVSYSQVLTPAVAAQLNTVGPVRAPLTTNFIANYSEHQLSPYFSWTPANGVTVKGNVAEVDRSYEALSGQNVRSLFGLLAVDYDRKGRLSGGLGLHRDLGGSTLLASRLVETDGVDVHARYSLDALTRVDSRLALDRRRYSVDQPDFPAHREYETLFNLAVAHDLQHDLTVALDFTGDWRRANPSAFAYTDRRWLIRLRYQP